MTAVAEAPRARQADMRWHVHEYVGERPDFGETQVRHVDDVRLEETYIRHFVTRDSRDGRGGDYNETAVVKAIGIPSGKQDQQVITPSYITVSSEQNGREVQYDVSLEFLGLEPCFNGWHRHNWLQRVEPAS